MKKTVSLLSLIILLTCSLFAQNESFVLQGINIEQYKGSDFRLEGQMFTEEKSSGGGGSLISVMYTKDGRFIKSAFDRKVLENFKNNEWNKVTVTGKIDKKTDLLYVGPFFSGKIKLLYDDIRLFVKKEELKQKFRF